MRIETARRRKWLAALGVLLVGTVAFAPWPQLPADRVTRENYDRIEKGMSRAEVEALIGPPGDYRTGPSGIVSMTIYCGPSKGKLEAWAGDHGGICVYFGPDGVADKQFDNMQKKEQSPIADLRWRLERRWERWFAK
jgi:hypothetical protein